MNAVRATRIISITNRPDIKLNNCKHIGRGGLGNVFKHNGHALKSPHPIYGDFGKRHLYTEARILSNFVHPNIVALNGIGECLDETIRHVDTGSTVPFMAVEHLSGKDLGSYRKDWLRLPANEALIITRQIASALKAVHDLGFVHQDVKPENIIYDEDKQHATLIDFSLLDRPGTTNGKTTGTLSYMAPEKILHSRFDRRSDIYSLGLTLYSMLTGLPPLDMSGIRDDRHAMMGEYRRFGQHLANSRLPKAIKDLIVKMTYYEPVLKDYGLKHRFQNCDELISALDNMI